MAHKLARRDFFKAAGAGALASAATGAARAQASSGNPADLRLLGAAYVPIADYPIKPKRFSDVAVRDRFWQPKIKLNADVTIPDWFAQLVTAPLPAHVDLAGLKARLYDEYTALKSRSSRGMGASSCVFRLRVALVHKRIDRKGRNRVILVYA